MEIVNRWSQYKTSRLIQICTSVVISMIMIMRITQKIACGKPQFVFTFPRHDPCKEEDSCKGKKSNSQYSLNLLLSRVICLQQMDCFFILYYPKYTSSKGSEQSILVHSFTLPSETENPSAAPFTCQRGWFLFLWHFCCRLHCYCFIAVFNYGIIVMESIIWTKNKAPPSLISNAWEMIISS